jgi:V8-like Glu-specific endopeptidase/SH3-like domain-containing protein
MALACPVAAQDLVGFDRNSFGSVVLSNKQAAGAAGIELELAVGEYNTEPILNYSENSVFAQMGLAVGRLDVLTDKGVFPCTAFIVDNKHILTNNHCVPGILDNERAGATSIDSVMFIAGYRQTGVEEGTKRYTVIPTPIETHKDLDYSVLEVLGDPSAEFGTLKLAASLPNDGDPYWVIGHPMGEAQRISREQCRANSPAVSNKKLLHTCDTLPGNSGSPVIDAGLQQVVGLHHAGSRNDAVNYAIPMAAILERSQVLRAAQDAALPVERPRPVDPVDPVIGVDDQTDTGQMPVAVADICDDLYKEAKAYGQCFAYNVYLEQCAEHTFSVFAKAYVDSECQTPVVDGGDAPVIGDGGDTPDIIDGGGGGGIQPPPGTDEVIVEEIRRPWCASPNLNSTERTICGDPYLAGLDAEMDRAYRNQRGKSTSGQQNTWRVSQRDACRSDTSCIASAYIERISYLNAPVITPPPSGGGSGGERLVAGNYALNNGRCYIITASRTNINDAKAFVRSWFAGNDNVRIFQSNNGNFGIVLETVSKSRADQRLANLKSKGRVPSDSYCTTGTRFVAELKRASAGGGGGGGTKVMYVDNNSAGGLNVRSGPGTNFNDFAELSPGDRVTILKTSGKWSNIRMPNGRTGWVYSPLLTSSKPYVRQCTARVVNLDPYNANSRNTGLGFLNLRAKDSAKSKILSEAYLGDSLRVLARKGNWARVECISGQCKTPYRGQGGVRAWASTRYLSIRCQ